MSYEKDKLDSYLTSASLATALAPYITSASVSAAIASAVAGLDLAPYMTSNSISAAVVTDALTVRGAASVSATLAASAVTVAGRPIGSVLLAYSAITNQTSFAFSGSWSDYCMLEINAVYRMSASATASLHLFTDGGVSPIISMQTTGGLVGGPAAVLFNGQFLGGNGLATKTAFAEWRSGTAGLGEWTGTANAGFVNCIRVLQSKTMSSGMAFLIGYRTT